jgi:hypothetical protein
MPVHCKRRNYASLCGLAPMLATRSPLDTGLRICSCITVCHCTSSGSAGHAMKVVAVAACTEPRRLRLVGNHQLINVGCASWGSWSSSTEIVPLFRAVDALTGIRNPIVAPIESATNLQRILALCRGRCSTAGSPYAYSAATRRNRLCHQSRARSCDDGS